MKGAVSTHPSENHLHKSEDASVGKDVENTSTAGGGRVSPLLNSLEKLLKSNISCAPTIALLTMYICAAGHWYKSAHGCNIQNCPKLETAHISSKSKMYCGRVGHTMEYCYKTMEMRSYSSTQAHGQSHQYSVEWKKYQIHIVWFYWYRVQNRQN